MSAPTERRPRTEHARTTEEQVQQALDATSEAGELHEVHVFGPPGCLAGDTSIGINRAGKGGAIRIDRLVAAFNGAPRGYRGGRTWDLAIPTYVQRAVGGTVRLGRLLHAWESGEKEVLRLATEHGRTIVATDEHPFLTGAGRWTPLGHVGVGEVLQVRGSQGTAGRRRLRYASTYTRFHPRQRPAKSGHRVATHRLAAEAVMNDLDFGEYVRILRTDANRAATLTYLTPDVVVHHANHDHSDNRPENLRVLTGGQAEHANEHAWGDNVLARVSLDKVVSVQSVGAMMTYDLEVADDPHCFIANEFVVHNTGKTTRLSRMITSTAVHRGAGSVLVSSFTVAAATELAGRGLPLPKAAIGTLHAHANRALERPLLVADHIEGFNDAHPGYALTVSGRRRSGTGEDDVDQPVEEWTGATDGDGLAASAERLRNQLVPRDEWPGDVRRFHDRWEAWKTEEGLFDFTDLIEVALRDVHRAPGDPQVIFGDEAQDNTPLELALYRAWGRRAEKLILGGDDDQSIYSFRGATPDGLLNTEPQQTIVLGQSYRIPGAVHRAAEMWIRRVSRRAEKEYLPRVDEDGAPHEGRAGMSRVTFDDTAGLMNLVEKHAGQGRSVMVQAACSYMLDPIKHEMKRAGMPYANPWRRTRGDWNPMGSAGEGRVSSRERVLSYLLPDEEEFGAVSRLWTGEDVRRWGEVVAAKGVFRHGVKQALKDLPNRELSQDEFMGLLRPELSDAVLDRMVGPDLSWLAENVTASKQAGMAYPLAVAKKRGGAALLREPQVYIGTTHSFKGSQADVVLLIPDLSRRFHDEYVRVGVSRDSIVRQFYVAMTRAREELVVLSASSDMAVAPARLLQGARAAA